MSTARLRITSARFDPPPNHEMGQAIGLVCVANIVLNHTLTINRIELTRRSGGRLEVAMPAWRDSDGYDHPAVQLDRAVHADVEQQIAAELDRQRRLAA